MELVLKVIFISFCRAKQLGITLAANRLLHPEDFLNMYLGETHTNTDSIIVQSLFNSRRTYTAGVQIHVPCSFSAFVQNATLRCPSAAFASTFLTKKYFKEGCSFCKYLLCTDELTGGNFMPILVLRNSQGPEGCQEKLK